MAYLLDNFDGAAGTKASLRTADSGDTYVQMQNNTNSADSPVVTGAGRVRRNSASAVFIVTAAQMATADYEVEGTWEYLSFINTGREAGGVLGRGIASTTGTSYRAAWWRDANSNDLNINLQRNVGSAATPLGTNPVVITGFFSSTPASFRLKLRMVGTAVTILVDDIVRLGPVTDSAPLTAAGSPGFYQGYSSTVAETDTTGIHLSKMAVYDLGTPINTAAPAVTGTVAIGQVLSCSTGTWSNGPTGYAYQWTRNGSNITGATSASYTVLSSDAGTTLACVVTASNASGNAGQTSNGIAIPAAPVNTAVPSITTDGTPQAGETVTSTTGTWTGTGITYTYQWKRASADIAGATSSSYALQAADVGTAVTVVVTATNGGGTANAVSSPITPAAAPSIAPSAIGRLYSGGAGNTVNAASVGGARGTALPQGTTAPAFTFAPTPGTAAATGTVQYRLIYYINNHPTATFAGVKVYLATPYAAAGTHLAIGVPTEGVSVDVVPVATGATAPAGVTFSEPATLAAGLALGDLPPGGYRGLWLRYTVDPAAPAVADVAALVRINGSPA